MANPVAGLRTGHFRSRSKLWHDFLSESQFHLFLLIDRHLFIERDFERTTALLYPERDLGSLDQIVAVLADAGRFHRCSCGDHQDCLLLGTVKERSRLKIERDELRTGAVGPGPGARLQECRRDMFALSDRKAGGRTDLR